MAFSDMEGAAEQFIWAYIGVDPRHGKVLTGMDARKKFEILQKLASEHIEKNVWKTVTSDIWKQLEELNTLRNLLAHGMLHMLDKYQVAAISYRKGAIADTVQAALIIPEHIKYNIEIARHIEHLFLNQSAAYRNMPQSARAAQLREGS